MTSPSGLESGTEPRERLGDRPIVLPVRRGGVRSLVSDVLFVARREKKWWLLPLLALLAVLVAFLMFAAAAGPLAPFIYPLL